MGILPSFKDTPPKKMLVNELQTVLLNCRGYGSPMPTIKWDFETEMISTDERIKIFENGSLYIQHARSEDSGRYGCTIGNSAGFKRTETLLTVKRMFFNSINRAFHIYMKIILVDKRS